MAWNELADRRAKAGDGGTMNVRTQPINTGGYKTSLPLYGPTPHLKSDVEELRGLTHVHTDQVPMLAWLFQTGRPENPFC